MKSLRREIEQLAEAAHQLRKGTPTGARLALILVDNAVELLMHEKVKELFALDARMRNFQPRTFRRKKRDEVLAHFNEKVKVIVKHTEDIGRDDGEVFKAAHRLRNEAYHQGVLRERVIPAVARTYFEAACRCMPALWRGQYGASDWSEVGEFLKTYGEAGSTVDREKLASICNRLLNGCTCPVPELADLLSCDLLERIEQLRDGLDVLPRKRDATADATLKVIFFGKQFQWADDVTEMPKTREEEREFRRRHDEAFAAFTSPVTLATMDGWERTANNLLTTTTPGEVLRQFIVVDRPLVGTEDAVGEAIAEYESQIGL